MLNPSLSIDCAKTQRCAGIQVYTRKKTAEFRNENQLAIIKTRQFGN